MKLVTDTELLARFYDENDELDPNEKFLKSYILNEGWKEKASRRPEPDIADVKQRVDEEDMDREDEMEKFEAKYNFRFEEPNAATITSHARNANAEETMRRKESARKLARQRAKDNKEELARQRKEEIAKLKSLKREEIIDKLRKADHLAKGNLFKDRTLLERVSKELETDFIPDVYDKTMSKMFGEKYYEDGADEVEEEFDIEANKAIDLKLLQDQGELLETEMHDYLEPAEKL